MLGITIGDSVKKTFRGIGARRLSSAASVANVANVAKHHRRSRSRSRSLHAACLFESLEMRQLLAVDTVSTGTITGPLQPNSVRASFFDDPTSPNDGRLNTSTLPGNWQTTTGPI